jgi:hypothetical protein
MLRGLGERKGITLRRMIPVSSRHYSKASSPADAAARTMIRNRERPVEIAVKLPLKTGAERANLSDSLPYSLRKAYAQK